MSMRCWGSFQGKKVICPFGASRADSSATAKGCESVSSGITKIGVVHFPTLSRVTLKTKSGITIHPIKERLTHIHRNVRLLFA